MAFVNYNNKEITVKIVYYGPALSGKTTCLQYTYESGEYRKKGKLITLDTDGDRTLFFDFLPIEIGKLGDYSIKMQLYTVPGQVAYNTTRKLVLQGSDGIVFVADSQVVMREQNIDSFNNLKENLKSNNISFAETPLIFQYNKRDLREILPLDILNSDLNPENKPFFPTIGTTGENIQEALATIMKMVIIHLRNKLSIFQKDKTVMFSRDEVTDSIKKDPPVAKSKPAPPPPPRAAAPSPPPPQQPKPAAAPQNKSARGIYGEDTEREEIFELSSPVGGESLKTITYPKEKEDDIFNLGDESRFESSESQHSIDIGDDLDVPEVVIDDELGNNEPLPKPTPPKKPQPKAVPEPPAPVVESEDSVQELGQEYQVKAEDISNGSIDVPLHIDIPADKDQITINLNLRIVIKKKP